MGKAKSFKIGGVRAGAGSTRDIRLKVSERYSGDAIHLPVRVIRGTRSGAAVFVTAAIHGEELNGVGITHELMYGEHLKLRAGTLLLVPVVNVFGFDTQDRYMPDRRDLNRCFPGSETGSLSSRVAHIVFNEIALKCDYGIDLHTAASQRTNFPNVRGDFSVPAVRRLARMFGCELMVNNKGPVGSFRREAVKAGCATIALEAGEPLKIEPGVLEVGMRGVHNVLISLGMMDGEPIRPAYQVRVNRSIWVRAEVGGILRFHVAPGDFVEQGQAIATNASVFGETLRTLVSPVDGIVLGMTTLPLVKPGEPVCHVAVPTKTLRSLRKALAVADGDSLHHRLRQELATSVAVTEQEGEPASRAVPEGA